jgi:hypothetical protein
MQSKEKVARPQRVMGYAMGATDTGLEAVAIEGAVVAVVE